MAHNNTTEDCRVSLLTMNDYCLLKIFSFLGLDDTINLANTCSRLRCVGDLAYMEIKEMSLDRQMLNEGLEYIEHIFSNFGQFILSVTVNLQSSIMYECGRNVLKTIRDNCKHLKYLTLEYWCEKDVQSHPVLGCFQSVEMLTLRYCEIPQGSDFFQSFGKLKFFNMISELSNYNVLQTVFENNPDIESFACCGAYFHEFQLLQLLPEIKQLSVNMEYDSIHPQQIILEFQSLLQLEKLTKLQVRYCFSRRSFDNFGHPVVSERDLKLNEFLNELARKGILEELDIREIGNIDIDIEADTIKSFEKLKLLRIGGLPNGLVSPLALPTTLKHLRLECEISFNDFTSMIKELENLETIDLRGCSIESNDKKYFSHESILYQQISKIRNFPYNRRTLNVILPIQYARDTSTKKYVYDSDRLRVLNNHGCTLGKYRVSIHFPGFNKICL